MAEQGTALKRTEEKKVERHKETAPKPAVAQREYFAPEIDLMEGADSFLLSANIPGADEKSVSVTVERNVLSIRAESDNTAPEGYRPLYTENEAGGYIRELTLSDSIDREGITATVKNGVLRLTLPKAEKARTIKIEVNKG